jgi:hypothetical protein
MEEYDKVAWQELIEQVEETGVDEWYIMLQAFFFLERKSQEYVIKIILGPCMVEYLNNTHQKNRNYHSFFLFFFLNCNCLLKLDKTKTAYVVFDSTNL